MLAEKPGSEGQKSKLERIYNPLVLLLFLLSSTFSLDFSVKSWLHCGD